MDDEAFYEAVVHELEHHGLKKGLWAKAFATAGGNESIAKALYLEWRVSQLKEERDDEQLRQRELQRQVNVREATELAKRQREQQVLAQARQRFRPFANMLRGLGLPVETVILQLEAKGPVRIEAKLLANEVFRASNGT